MIAWVEDCENSTHTGFRVETFYITRDIDVGQIEEWAKPPVLEAPADPLPAPASKGYPVSESPRREKASVLGGFRPVRPFGAEPEQASPSEKWGSPGADAPMEGSHLVPTHGMVSGISTNRETSIITRILLGVSLFKPDSMACNYSSVNRVFDLAKSVPDHTINLPLYALIKLLCRVRSIRDDDRFRTEVRA